MTKFFDNFESELNHKSLKTIIYEWSHKTLEFLVKNVENIGKFSQYSTTRTTRVPLGTWD